MSIFNDLLVEFVIQDIISANSTRIIKPFFNTLINIQSMTNFYAIDSSFLLTCHYSKEHKNSSIKNNIS